MTKKPYALANALRKVSNDPAIEAVEGRDVAQLFFDNPKPSTHKSASWDNIFATHPPVEKRIELLEQFVYKRCLKFFKTNPFTTSQNNHYLPPQH